MSQIENSEGIQWNSILQRVTPGLAYPQLSVYCHGQMLIRRKL